MRTVRVSSGYMRTVRESPGVYENNKNIRRGGYIRPVRSSQGFMRTVRASSGGGGGGLNKKSKNIAGGV